MRPIAQLEALRSLTITALINSLESAPYAITLPIKKAEMQRAAFNRTVRTLALLGAITATLSLIGCGPNGSQRGKSPTEAQIKARVTRSPKHAPYPPAPVPTPLDPALADAARQVLRTALHSEDAVSRTHALEALQDVEAKHVLPEDAGAIIAALNDPQPVVRFAAALVVGQLHLTAARAALLKIAYDKSPSVRVGVRFALHKLGDTHLSHDLEQLSQDPLPRARANTALVLGLLGDETALRILRPMRIDREATVRQQASEAMWRLGDEQGLEDLVGLSVSRYPDDQMIGLLAVAEPRDHRVIGHEQGALVSDYAEVALVAARGVGMLGSDEGYQLAANGAKSSDPRQRQLGALALGAIGRTDAQEKLRPLLEDSDGGVKIAAAEAILQLRPQVDQQLLSSPPYTTKGRGS